MPVNLNSPYLIPLLYAYAAERSAFEQQTSAAVFPNFWTWCLGAFRAPGGR